jgi:hypothetical protein
MVNYMIVLYNEIITIMNNNINLSFIIWLIEILG